MPKKTKVIEVACPKGRASVPLEEVQPEEAQETEEVMCTPPDWAKGIPLGVEIHSMQRYGK